MNESAMLAAFAEEELHHFEGRGGKEMTYVEDETVMDRLDIGYGRGNWQILTEPVPVYEGVVKVRLGVRVDKEWVWYEDYGYPNRSGGESLKEAVSDGIRRCGRYVGIARDLYRRDESPRASAAPARPPVARPAARPRAVPNTPDADDAEIEAFVSSAYSHATGGGTPPAASGSDNSDCPIHGVTWNGSWGDLWHKTPDGAYCRHPENIARRAGAR